MKKFICVCLLIGFLGGCGPAVGLLLTSGGEGTSQTQPTNRLNYYNYGDRQECLNRNLMWKMDSSGRMMCM